MKTVRPLGFSGAILAFAALCACHEPGKRTPAAPPLASFQEIMLARIDASADKIWGASGSIVDPAGDHSLAPKTEADWQALRAAVIALNQGAGDLTRQGRPLVQPGAKIQDEGAESVATPDEIRRALIEDRPIFLQRAQALQAVAAQTLAAVDRKDLAALERHGEALDAACEACHEHFWYPPKTKL